MEAVGNEAVTWSDGTRHLAPGVASNFDCGISGLKSYWNNESLHVSVAE